MPLRQWREASAGQRAAGVSEGRMPGNGGGVAGAPSARSTTSCATWFIREMAPPGIQAVNRTRPPSAVARAARQLRLARRGRRSPRTPTARRPRFCPRAGARCVACQEARVEGRCRRAPAGDVEQAERRIHAGHPRPARRSQQRRVAGPQPTSATCASRRAAPPARPAAFRRREQLPGGLLVVADAPVRRGAVRQLRAGPTRNGPIVSPCATVGSKVQTATLFDTTNRDAVRYLSTMGRPREHDEPPPPRCWRRRSGSSTRRV